MRYMTSTTHSGYQSRRMSRQMSSGCHISQMSSGCHIMLHVNVRHMYVISHRYMRYMTSATHSGYRMSRQIYDIHYSCRMQTYM